MHKSDIRMGDIVRLRNGELVEVDSVTNWYADRNGRHDGPFVTTRQFDHYLIADVTEIVTPNSRRCVYCGNGVTSPNPDVDFCRNCHYSGTPQEFARNEQISKLELDTNASCSVDHTGGGCFWLSFRFADEP